MDEFFSPAHVSGFFSIYEDANPSKMGSTGGGICLDKGVITSARARKGKGEIDIYINGAPLDAPVTRRVAQKLLPKGYDLSIRIEAQLPIGQGFGMSGAGALTTAMAVADLFGVFTREEVIKVAHETEVEFKTGLGDVAAQSVGGVVIRPKPGIPPYGLIEKLEGEGEIILTVIGGPLSTKKVLEDSSKRHLINQAAFNALESLSKNRSIENLFRASYEFALRSNLMSPEVGRGVEEARKHGLASMAMLGNSLFAMGNSERIAQSLNGIGTVYTCSVDGKGAREW